MKIEKDAIIIVVYYLNTLKKKGIVEVQLFRREKIDIKDVEIQLTIE